MKLKLKRPLIIFDLETTGVNVQTDRIVEITVIKKFPGRKKDIIKTKLVNPQRAIPKEATEVHGITDDMVKDAPTFKVFAESFAEFIEGCDVVGYNSNRFDIPFLLNEFERAGIYSALENVNFIDVFNLYCHFNPRTLEAAYMEYCNKKLDAHKSLEDAKATIEVLEAMLNEHSDEIESNEVEYLAQLSKKRKNIDILGVVIEGADGDPVFSIGKHKGQKIKDCRSYCDWIVNKSDFSENTKKVIRKILKE